MTRTFATNLFDEARRAPRWLIASVLVAHGLLLFLAIHVGAVYLEGFRAQYEATAAGRVVGFGVLKAWTVLSIEAGLILFALGGIRPADVGLRIGALPGGLFAVAGVWL